MYFFPGEVIKEEVGLTLEETPKRIVQIITYGLKKVVLSFIEVLVYFNLNGLGLDGFALLHVDNQVNVLLLVGGVFLDVNDVNNVGFRP